MKARLKSGRIITGKLAETFSRIGLAVDVDAVEKPKRKRVAKKKTAKKKVKK